MNPPANVEAIEWFMLTTIDGSLAVNTEQCLRGIACVGASKSGIGS